MLFIYSRKKVSEAFAEGKIGPDQKKGNTHGQTFRAKSRPRFRALAAPERLISPPSPSNLRLVLHANGITSFITVPIPKPLRRKASFDVLRDSRADSRGTSRRLWELASVRDVKKRRSFPSMLGGTPKDFMRLPIKFADDNYAWEKFGY